MLSPTLKAFLDERVQKQCKQIYQCLKGKEKKKKAAISKCYLYQEFYPKDTNVQIISILLPKSQVTDEEATLSEL